MRKLLLGVAAAGLLAAPAALEAQNVAVGVTIASTASGTLVESLNFGNVAPGSGTTTIATGSTPAGLQTLGAIEIAHSGNFSVSAATNTPSLAGPGDAITATLSCQLMDAAVAGSAVNGAASDCTSIPNWTGAGNTTYFLQIGGTLAAIPQAQTSGSYTVTVAFTVSPL